MSNKVTLIIKISENYKLQCHIVDSNKKETLIQLNNKNQQEQYLLSSSLIDKKNSIQFAHDLFINPQDFKLYNIELYEKEYTVIAEVLFALIISEFKEQIEKEFIIEKTIVQLPVQNLKVNSRIITALNAIGLDKIELKDDEQELNFDYKSQGEILQEILEKKHEYSKRKRMIERANEIAKEQKIPEIQIDDESLASEQEFQKALTKYSTEQRNKMKLYELDNYCIFIASRYFSSIYDHINLTKVCKRLKYNMDKFHYNPIEVTDETVKFFF